MLEQTTPTNTGNPAPPSASGDPPVAASPPPASTPTDSSSASKATPDWLQGFDAYWDGEKGELKGSDLAKALKEGTEAKAAIDAARAGIPESADKYALDLPQDFKLPDGFQLKTDDPRIATLREAAHEAGLDQTKFSGLLAKLAAADATDKVAQAKALSEQIERGKQARDAALGPNGGARVDALHGWFDATADEATASELKNSLITPRVIEHMEKMAAAFVGGGIPGFSSKGREAVPDDGRPSNWGQMSTVDRQVWLRQNKPK